MSRFAISLGGRFFKGLRDRLREDLLNGEGDDDTLIGGWGRDRLAGGAGDDLLMGRGAMTASVAVTVETRSPVGPALTP